MNDSSSQFVRLLKSSSDPPTENGSLKIEIAEKAWSDASFYVPRKAQIISDWLVNRLLKDSKTSDPASSVLNVRYWALLSKVITPNGAASNQSVHNWLVPLLSRVSFVQITISFFSSLKLLLQAQETQLIASVNTCLTVIWPPVALRSNTDSLLELFGALLALSPQKCESDDFACIVLRLVASFRSSLESCSTKRKIYEAFMKHHLLSWVDCVMDQSSSSTLIKDIYNAGADILFNLDILRLIVGSGPEILFDSLNVLDCDTLYLLLPRLFSTAVENIRKYKGFLFHPNQLDASLNDVHSGAMRFFVACETLLDNQDFKREAWTCRIALLSIIQKESLVYHEPTASQLFSKTILLALDVLDHPSDDIAVASYSIDCFHHLAKIDYSLVSPILPSIIPAILRMSHYHENLCSLLDLLLEYHTKTRTIDIYLGLLFSSLSSPHFTSHHHGPRKLYEIATSSAVFHPKHLEHLSQAIAIFLTESLLTTIKSALDAVNSAWQSLQDCNTEERPKKKKRRTDGNSTSSPSRADRETFSLVFSLTVKLTSVILASLPSRLSAATHTEVLLMIERFQDSALRQAISKLLKAMHRGDKDWSTAIATAALLQLECTFNLQPRLCPNPSLQEKHLNKLLELELSSLIPELCLEIFRTLLIYSSAGHFRSPLLFERILTYLNENLHDDARQSFISFLHVHWLPTIDSQCSKTQVEIFIWNFIVHQRNNGYHLENLDSADFWELPNVRAALLNYADNNTRFLDHHANEVMAIDSQQVHSILMIFKILLLFPAEYCTRPLKISFINRAVAADILLANDTTTPSFDCLLVLRIFISRSLRAIELPPRSLHSLFLHLLDSPLNSPDHEGLLAATLDVCEACLLSMLRMHDSTEMILQVLGSMVQNLSSDSFITQSMPARLFVRTIDLLSLHFVAENMPSEVQLELRRNHDVLSTKLFSKMNMSQRNTESVEGEGSLIEGWRRTMLLGRWLGLPDRSVPPIAASLLARLAQSLSNHEESEEVNRRYRSSAVEAFYLLLEEFYSCRLDRLKVLKTILLTYVQIYYSVGMDVLPSVDEPFSQTCAALSIPEFEHIIQQTFELLAHSFACVIHLWTILMQNPPKNTFQMMQAFMMRCLNALVDHSGYVVQSAGLRQEVLHFLVRRCTERATALRPIELNSIWTLISKMLTSSTNHADQTTVTVFTDIVTIISTLVRLRRDLVVFSLSHLGLALRQLVMLLRAPRPHLGGKQAALVGNTFPCWINIQCPLGPEQGKVLSRLLQTLSAKTVPKCHSTSATLRRAASLAKPFSKHAAYVLQAYVDAVNDPLCLLTTGVRKELEPGLFALCDMLSEQNRDSFMLSALDSSGKAIMKSLWREYEKQHYAGTG